MKIQDIPLETCGFKFNKKLWIVINKQANQVEIYNILSGDSQWIVYDTEVEPVQTVLS